MCTTAKIAIPPFFLIASMDSQCIHDIHDNLLNLLFLFVPTSPPCHTATYREGGWYRSSGDESVRSSVVRELSVVTPVGDHVRGREDDQHRHHRQPDRLVVTTDELSPEPRPNVADECPTIHCLGAHWQSLQRTNFVAEMTP